MRGAFVIARHSFRMLRRDPVPVAVMAVMPLVVMPFVKPLADLGASALPEPTGGAAQAIPGLGVMFSMFLITSIGYFVFQEHSWGTWDRIRASGARPAEVMLGKAMIPIAVVLVQLTSIYLVGMAVFGLRLRGSFLILVGITVFHALVLASIGLALVAVLRTVQQFNAATYLGSFLLAGLGGAVTPVELLPGWVLGLAPALPTYWAARGLRETFAGTASAQDGLVTIVVLAGFAGLFLTIAALRFDATATKVGWA